MNPSVEACERKATRPCIIVPQPRPVSTEVAATGSRRLPEPTTSVIPTGSIKRTFEDLGLILTDDEDADEVLPVLSALQTSDSAILQVKQSPKDAVGAPLKKLKTMLIEPQRGLGFCKYRFAKGNKKGTVCGLKCTKTRDLCGVHMATTNKKTSISASSENSVNTAVTDKIMKLERIVLSLLKDKPSAPLANQEKTQSASTLDSVNATLDKIRNQIHKIEQTAELALNKKPQKKSRNIQKIRIYKLDPFETYLLVRYKDGHPIFQMKSSGRYVQVPLPTRMVRPVPNGSWSLVCHPEQPRMIWKEV